MVAIEIHYLIDGRWRASSQHMTLLAPLLLKLHADAPSAFTNSVWLGYPVSCQSYSSQENRQISPIITVHVFKDGASRSKLRLVRALYGRPMKPGDIWTVYSVASLWCLYFTLLFPLYTKIHTVNDNFLLFWYFRYILLIFLYIYLNNVTAGVFHVMEYFCMVVLLCWTGWKACTHSPTISYC